MLKVKQLTKKFKNQKGIHQISFECYPSEVMGIIGDNGSGKSTLLKSLALINGIDQGVIELFNKELNINDVGFLPEHKAIIEDLSGRDFIELFARMRLVEDIAIEKTLKDFASALNAHECLDVKIKTLSKGNKQKIQIMAACISKPVLIILDEPFSGLDEQNSIHMKNFILELKKNNHIILVSSHRVEDIEQVCDTLCWIKEGKLSEKQSVHHLKEQSSTIHVKVSLDPFQQFKDEKGIVDVFHEGHVSIYTFEHVSFAHQFMRHVLKHRSVQTVSIHNQVCMP
jgi:ABC-2 type transport system ATP-binding protein